MSKRTQGGLTTRNIPELCGIFQAAQGLHKRQAGCQRKKPAPAPAPEAEDGYSVTAPMVGTFYAASAPGAGPYVQVGDRVSEGDTLCIIEAMKMMNQIEADVSGVIKSIRVQDGDPVEYGQTLFVIDQRAAE